MIIGKRSLFTLVMASLPGLVSATLLYAELGVGTWVRQADAKNPVDITMTVEPCCNGGRRLTYHIRFGNQTQVMVVESPFNGTAVPVIVDGKPSGETMAIKQTDSRHWTTTMTMDGKPFGTSSAEISVDGKTLNVENKITFAAAGQSAGVQKEVWTKK